MTARGGSGRNLRVVGRSWFEAFAVFSLLLAGPTAAAERLAGQVLGGGAPIANSTVTLWAASAGEPKQLATVDFSRAAGSLSLNGNRVTPLEIK